MPPKKERTRGGGNTDKLRFSGTYGNNVLTNEAPDSKKQLMQRETQGVGEIVQKTVERRDRG